MKGNITYIIIGGVKIFNPQNSSKLEKFKLYFDKHPEEDIKKLLTNALEQLEATDYINFYMYLNSDISPINGFKQYLYKKPEIDKKTLLDKAKETLNSIEYINFYFLVYNYKNKINTLKRFLDNKDFEKDILLSIADDFLDNGEVENEEYLHFFIYIHENESIDELDIFKKLSNSNIFDKMTLSNMIMIYLDEEQYQIFYSEIREDI